MSVRETLWFTPKKLNLARVGWSQVKPYPGTAVLWIVWQMTWILWELVKFLLLIASYLTIFLARLALAFLAGALLELVISSHQERRR